MRGHRHAGPAQHRPAAEAEAEDDWRRAMVLLGTATDEELLDPALRPTTSCSACSTRTACACSRPAGAQPGCGCDEERVRTHAAELPPGRSRGACGRRTAGITVTCQFCSRVYRFDQAPAERAHAPGGIEHGEAPGPARRSAPPARRLLAEGAAAARRRRNAADPARVQRSRSRAGPVPRQHELHRPTALELLAERAGLPALAARGRRRHRLRPGHGRGGEHHRARPADRGRHPVDRADLGDGGALGKVAVVDGLGIEDGSVSSRVEIAARSRRAPASKAKDNFAAS